MDFRYWSIYSPPRSGSVCATLGFGVCTESCGFGVVDCGGSMSRERLKAGIVLAALMVALSPRLAVGQGDLGAIAGVVKDSTGGVLPGVTVEVSSPALI